MVERVNTTIPEPLKRIMEERGWSPAELLRKKIEEELLGKKNLLITFPAKGKTVALPTGDNWVDFYNGNAVLANGKPANLSTSLKTHKFDYAESILIYTDQQIDIGFDDNSARWTIDAGSVLPIPHQQFKKMLIVTTTATNIRLWAHTDPDGLPSIMALVRIWDGTEVAGVTTRNALLIEQEVSDTPICKLDYYAGNSSDYQTLATWTVTTGKVGLLKEISFGCESAGIGVAQFQLVIGTTTYFTDKMLATGSIPSLPFENVELAAGTVVTVSGKSDGATTLKMNGTITGRERSV